MTLFYVINMQYIFINVIISKEKSAKVSNYGEYIKKEC